MPWLADLVESSEGSLSILPVQCLCEFLLNSSSSNTSGLNEAEGETKRRKEKQLLLHLQNLLQSLESDKRACYETLDYFLRRLSSQQTQQRLQALKGLRMVLTPLDHQQQQPMEVGSEEDQWLLRYLPLLPCFTDLYPHVSASLRHACQVENDPDTVGLYVQFLVRFAPQGLSDLADLCLDMSSVIVERSTILPAILPGPQCRARNAIDTHRYAHYESIHAVCDAKSILSFSGLSSLCSTIICAGCWSLVQRAP